MYTLQASHVMAPKWYPEALAPHTLHGGRMGSYREDFFTLSPAPGLLGAGLFGSSVLLSIVKTAGKYNTNTKYSICHHTPVCTCTISCAFIMIRGVQSVSGPGNFITKIILCVMTLKEIDLWLKTWRDNVNNAY